MKVKVTQKDIDNGKAKDCRTCPIAQAIRRTNPNKVIIVDRDIIYIDKKLYSTPQKASTFINLFDDGDKVKPIDFELNEI